MSARRVLLPLMAVLSLAACKTSTMSGRVEELERENQDLVRQNQMLREDATAARARADALERQLRDMTVRPAESPDKKSDMGDGITVETDKYGQTVIDVPSDLFFGSGISNLSKNGKAVLRKIGEWIQQNYPNNEIRIDGHADSDPIKRTKSKYHCNWDLSMERAHSVMHYMTDTLKFKSKKVMCAAFGSHRPQSPGNKSKNRRVEIVILQDRAK